jgi:hypothetical protein
MVARDQDGLAGHRAAGLGAAEAAGGAGLTMIVRVLAAFGSAGVADFGAEFAYLIDEIGTTRQLADGKGAEIGAGTVQLYAAGHGLDVVLAQAGRGAGFARDDAFRAGFEAGFLG